AGCATPHISTWPPDQIAAACTVTHDPFTHTTVVVTPNLTNPGDKHQADILTFALAAGIREGAVRSYILNIRVLRNYHYGPNYFTHAADLAGNTLPLIVTSLDTPGLLLTDEQQHIPLDRRYLEAITEPWPIRLYGRKGTRDLLLTPEQVHGFLQRVDLELDRARRAQQPAPTDPTPTA
ncbi:MAG: hypothetical protein D6781_14320, partial [Verrucomicrobia bacterium]